MPAQLSTILFLAQTLAFMVLALGFVWLNTNYQHLIKRLTNLKLTDSDKISKRLAKADATALQIIEETKADSLKLVNNLGMSTTEVTDEVRIALKQAVELNKDLFTDRLDVAFKHLLEELKQASLKEQSKLTQATTSELENMTAVVSKMKMDLDTKMTETATTINDQLSAYATKQKEVFEAAIRSQVDALAKQYLSQVLTETEHEALVMKALEKAKGEGLFKDA